MATTPKLYVGTYAKYNNGSLFGEWVDLTDFSDFGEFMDHIRDLHSDEEYPEFMFQDFEGFPKCWYSESGIDEETFDKIIEFSELDDDQRDAVEAFLKYKGENWDISDIIDAYQGYYSSEADFGYEMGEQMLDDNNVPEWMYNYFDYEKYGRELCMCDYEFFDGYVFRAI